jgi:hypothetical protein
MIGQIRRTLVLKVDVNDDVLEKYTLSRSHTFLLLLREAHLRVVVVICLLLFYFSANERLYFELTPF